MAAQTDPIARQAGGWKPDSEAALRLRYSLAGPFWFGGIFAGVGLLFICIGWVIGLNQRHRLATYLPVRARVVSASVRTESDEEGVSYQPVIVYGYSVNGKAYQADGVLPMGGLSSSGGWASQTIAAYPPGSETTAWYDPEDPSRAFLVRRQHWFPYVFALFPTVFVLIGLSAIVLRRRARRAPTMPVDDGKNGFRLIERGTIRSRLRHAMAGGLLWYAYAGVLLGDYFVGAGRHPDTFFVIAASVTGVIGLVFVVPAVRYCRSSQDFLATEVRISQQRIRPGDTLRITLRQDILRPLDIAELALGLVCIRDDRHKSGSGVDWSSDESWSTWNRLIVGRSYLAGGHLEANCTLHLPNDASPSTPVGKRGFPSYRWHVAMTVRSTKRPALAALFPITVESSPAR